MAPGGPHYVFGYGSIVALDRLRRFLGRPVMPGEICATNLNGYVRKWNVAMDNARDLPGYKVYTDRDTGERPKVFVAFLNLAPREDSSANGLLVRVTHEDLRRFDGRERNYRRVDITGCIEADVDGPCIAYIGADDARARYDEGSASGRVCISRDYHDAVLQGFGALGETALERFHATTTAPEAPLRLLDVHSVPLGIS